MEPGLLLEFELRGKKKGSFFQPELHETGYEPPFFRGKKFYLGQSAFVNHKDFLLRVVFVHKKFAKKHLMCFMSFRLENANGCMLSNDLWASHDSLLRFWFEKDRYELQDHQLIAINKALNTMRVELFYGWKHHSCPECLKFFKNEGICFECTK